jgi:hypothetical protein
MMNGSGARKIVAAVGDDEPDLARRSWRNLAQQTGVLAREVGCGLRAAAVAKPCRSGTALGGVGSLARCCNVCPVGGASCGRSTGGPRMPSCAVSTAPGRVAEIGQRSASPQHTPGVGQLALIVMTWRSVDPGPVGS